MGSCSALVSKSSRIKLIFYANRPYHNITPTKVINEPINPIYFSKKQDRIMLYYDILRLKIVMINSTVRSPEEALQNVKIQSRLFMPDFKNEKRLLTAHRMNF